MKKEKINKLYIEKFISYNLHCGSSLINRDATSKPFLQGVRNNFCILNLIETRFCMRQSLQFLKKLLSQQKKILFIGIPKGAEKEFASLCIKNQHFLLANWSYGFFTNPQRAFSLEEKVLLKFKERPSLLFIFDLSLSGEAVKEALQLEIPIMAFVNTDENLESIDYPIPANVKSWKGGLFVYNLFFRLFHLYKKIKIMKS